MQVHKMTLIIPDFYEIGPQSLKEILENTKYPNHCIKPFVQCIESRDIGEWNDNHPLNKPSTFEQTISDLFK